MRELMVEALSADGHTVDPAEERDGRDQAIRGPGLRSGGERSADAADGRAEALPGDPASSSRTAAPLFVFITGEDEAPGYRTFLTDSKAPVVTKPFKLKEFRQMLGKLFPPA